MIGKYIPQSFNYTVRTLSFVAVGWQLSELKNIKKFFVAYF